MGPTSQARVDDTNNLREDTVDVDATFMVCGKDHRCVLFLETDEVELGGRTDGTARAEHEVGAVGEGHGLGVVSAEHGADPHAVVGV